jgi:phenol 2-monooxygenase
VSYQEGYGDAYKNYGIDETTGCTVILRPDQYVSWVGDFDDDVRMGKFFSGFMIEQQ